MGKIIVLVGPPNSGKSTWANTFISSNKDYVKISRDDFRKSFYDAWTVPNKIEDVITEIQDCSIDSFLRKGYNVVVDNTHCKLKYIDGIVKKYGQEHDILFKVFDVDKYTLIARNHYRSRIDGKSIPENVMERMINNFNELKENFEFKDIVHQ